VSNRALRRQRTREPKSKQGAAKRAIPSTGPSRKSTGSSGGILSWRPQFLVDIFTELRKVVWPSRPDVINLTIVVVIVTLILGAILGGIDLAFGYIIDRALLN
jgi:preprotein translocase subunit SecE